MYILINCFFFQNIVNKVICHGFVISFIDCFPLFTVFMIVIFLIMCATLIFCRHFVLNLFILCYLKKDLKDEDDNYSMFLIVYISNKISFINKFLYLLKSLCCISQSVYPFKKRETLR